VLAGVSLVLLALRAAASWLPGRALWGLDLARDLPLAGSLLLAVTAAAACIPAVGRRLERLVPPGGGIAAAIALVGVALLATFVWSHPDRALFTGDTRLRQGSFVTVEHVEQFAPQALRGDLLLHHTLPREVSARLPIAPGDVGRWQGALLAVITALAGLALARECGVRGTTFLAVAAAACGTAALALFTGYAKSSAEVAALTSVLVVALARAARARGGLLLAGVCVAIALLLHRSAIALLPAWFAVALVVVRPRAPRGAGAWLGLLAPLAALILVGPRLWSTLSTFDRAHHVPGLAWVFSFAHLGDVANALMLLAPAVLVLPVLLALPPRPTRGEGILAASLVLPALAVLLTFRPQQGLPRDWDVFAFVGSACAAVTAWRAGVLFAAQPDMRRMASALALLALVPALQWTALQSDAPRAWSRAESILIGPPVRDREERASGLATLGLLRDAHGEHEAASRLFQLSHEASPHPRRLVEWGIVASLSGHQARALSYFEQAARMDPSLASAWQGVLEVAISRGESVRAREAADTLERLDPANPALPEARRWLGMAREDPVAASRP